MQYELIKNSLNDVANPIKTVLINRGIDDWNSYLNLNNLSVEDPYNLNNINIASECFIKHFNNHDKILIMPDEDCDGYTSSAMLYLYIKSLDKDYPITYMMHSNSKSHGITDDYKNVPDDIKLFIIADASTNDAEECNYLISKGIDIIILDHHDDNYSEESEEIINYQTAQNNNAIIVNNQLSKKYINKELSGAGIVYRFLQVLDDKLWEDKADIYLDLCAVGNIADSMDMRSLETRYFVECGLRNFNNKFLCQLFNDQEFSTKGVLDIHNVSWYICPIINSITRIGTTEERDILFRAMTEQDCEFEYTKRNHEVIIENIYQHASRLARNAKSRQDKQRDIVYNEILDNVNKDDKVIIAISKKAHSGLVGLSAMKLADTMKRPTIILKPTIKNGEEILCGSCRNFDDSPVNDFKSLILQTKSFIFCSGHPNAAGLAIYPDDLECAKQQFNNLLQDIDFTTKALCDFVIDVDDLNVEFINQLYKAKWIWGTGIKEPKIAVCGILLNKSDIVIQGKNYDSIAFTIDDIKFVQFKLREGDPIYDFVNNWDADDNDQICIDVIGTATINAYDGILTPQFIINGVSANVYNT